MPWSGLVAGSLWNVSVSTKNKVCMVTVQEYQPPVENQELRLLQQLQMPGDTIQGRVLSWPKVICRQGNILVSQIVTHKVDYMQFLVVDLVKVRCFVFTDTVKHFLRSYALIGSVECCLSPDLHLLLLRLPREVARSHSSSLVLIGKTRIPSQPITIDKNPVDNTVRSRIHDRKHCMLLFDPRFPRRLISIYVNEFGTRCTLLSRDQETDATVLKRTVLLGQLSATQAAVADSYEMLIQNNHSSSSADAEAEGNEDNFFASYNSQEDNDDDDDDDSDDEDAVLMVFRTISCKAEYSRSADRLVLCCLMEDSLRSGIYVRLFLFDSDTFTLLSKCHQSLPIQDPTESVSVFQLVLSPCDNRVHIMLPGDDVGRFICSMNITKEITLSSLCRSTILQNMADRRDVDTLPVPPAVKRFLRFQSNKYANSINEE